MTDIRGFGWARVPAAALAVALLAGCASGIANSPNTIQTASQAKIPSGYAVFNPRPEHARVFVRTPNGIKYFDEEGYLHQVYEEKNRSRTHYVAWNNGRSWMIFLNDDGTFPTLEQGRRRNLREAARALHASRQITADQINGCVKSAHQTLAKEGTFRLNGGFEIDEARIYQAPRMPVEVQAPIRLGGAPEGGPDYQLVCEFDVVDDAPVFARASLHRP